LRIIVFEGQRKRQAEDRQKPTHKGKNQKNRQKNGGLGTPPVRPKKRGEARAQSSIDSQKAPKKLTQFPG
jgi:hypothetical protein